MTDSFPAPIEPSLVRQSSLDFAPRSEASTASLQRCSMAEFARLVDRCVGLCRRQDRSGLAVLWLQVVSLPRFGAADPAARQAAQALQYSLGQRVRRGVRGSDEVVLLDRGEVGVVLIGADPEIARKVQRRLVETLDAPFPIEAGGPVLARLHTSRADFPHQGRNGADIVRALRLAQTEVHPLAN